MREDIFKTLGSQETNDIQMSLNNFARANKFVVSELDFDILKTTTSAIDAKSSGTTTHTSIDNEPFPSGYLDNPAIKLKQSYEINFKPYIDNTINIYATPSNDYAQVLVTLKAGFKCDNIDSAKEMLYAEINKKLIFANIIIYHF